MDRAIKTDKSIIMAWNFNKPFSIIVLEQWKRQNSLASEKCIFPSFEQEIFIKIDHVFGYKSILNRFQSAWIIKYIFFGWNLNEI